MVHPAAMIRGRASTGTNKGRGGDWEGGWRGEEDVEEGQRPSTPIEPMYSPSIVVRGPTVSIANAALRSCWYCFKSENLQHASA